MVFFFFFFLGLWRRAVGSGASYRSKTPGLHLLWLLVRVQGAAKGDSASENAAKKEAPKFNAAPPPLTSYTADVALAMASATMAGRQGVPVAPAAVQAVRHALHCP